jgi:transglutaminase-like putative cysteine protease
MKRITLLAGVLICGLLFAAQPPLDLLARVTTEKYPDADVVTVFDSTAYAVEASGRNVRHEHLLVKLLTQAGKERYDKYTESYTTIYNTLKFTLAQVITPQGKVIPVPAKSITDVPMPCFEGSKFILPNVHIVTVTFPGLEVGSSIEVIVEDRTHNPAMDNEFDTYDVFEDFDPIISKTLSVTTPASMKLRWHAYNGTVQCDSVKSGSRVTRTWSAHDVARIVAEPQMPPLPDVAAKVLISTQPDWQSMSRWYYNLSRPQFETDTALDRKIEELTVGKTDTDSKILALYYFVAANVRYVETELSGKKGGYTPEKASLTYQKRYGVCRDKAGLLVAMLRHIGVDACIVLTNPGERVEKELPVDQFDHAIVAIRRADGSYYYADPTVEYCRELLAQVEMNKGVLVCDSLGEDLAYTPVLPGDHEVSVTTLTDTLAPDGMLRGNMVLALRGVVELGMRNMLNRIPPEMRKQQLNNFVLALGPSAVMDTYAMTDPADMAAPLEVRLHFQVPNFATVSGNELSFASSGGSSMGLGGAPWSLPTRKYPVYLGMTLGSDNIGRMTLPPGYRAKLLPDTFNIARPDISVRHTVNVTGNLLAGQSEFRLNSLLIPLSDYAALRAAMSRVEEVGRQQVVLTK